MLKLVSLLYTTGYQRGLDVCDIIFEGGSREVTKGTGG